MWNSSPVFVSPFSYTVLIKLQSATYQKATTFTLKVICKRNTTNPITQTYMEITGGYSIFPYNKNLRILVIIDDNSRRLNSHDNFRTNIINASTQPIHSPISKSLTIRFYVTASLLCGLYIYNY
jgi:hypothetical protein